MKKITQKLAFLLLLVTYLVAVSSISTVFAAEKTMSITFRIEGIEKNMLYVTKDVPYTDTLTLQKALTYIDSQEDSITITGVDTAYITDINGESAGKFGGWDGWLYKVNGQDAVVGIDSLELKDGDSVLLYYGDPYGVGMQFPVADTSDISNGVITFTSSDTTYDSNYNPVVTVNPVKAVTVTWTNGDKSTDYVTDKNGSIKIDNDQLTQGSHAVQISKIGETKLPLVLRFTPDYTVNVDTVVTNNTVTDTTTSDSTTAASTASDNNASSAVTEAPKTGEQPTAAIIFLVLAITASFGVIFFGRKAKNEN